MEELAKSTRTIAALSLFSELRNRNVEIWEVVARLVIGSARRRDEFEITIAKALNWLLDDYGFQIYNSVLTSICLSSNLLKKVSNKSQKFVINNTNDEEQREVDTQLSSLQEDADKVIERLHEYVHQRTGTVPSAEQRSDIEKSFFNLLLEEDYRDAHTPIVSQFIISCNNSDSSFDAKCKAIAEGLIIYQGLSHDFPDAVETFKMPLTLILDTEMLYNLLGYNGPIFKQLADEFRQTVESINTLCYESNKGRIITLRYLPDTESEINGMFRYVENLKCNNRIPNRITNVTNHLLHSCQDRASVAIEKGRFFRELAQLGILPLDLRNVVRDAHFEVVDIDKQENETYEECEDYDFGLDVVTLTDIDDIQDSDYEYVMRRLQRLNDVNQLRKSKFTDNKIENAGYVLVTGTYKVLEKSKELSNDKKVFKGYPLAKSLAGITCALWFKSKNTLNIGQSPMNINGVVKARLSLSLINSGLVKKKYDIIVQQFKNHIITQEELLHNIAAVMSLPFTPERINSDDDFMPSMEDVDEELKRSSEERERQRQQQERDDIRRKEMIKKLVVQQNEIYHKQYDIDNDSWQQWYDDWQRKKGVWMSFKGILSIGLICLVFVYYLSDVNKTIVGFVVLVMCAVATIWPLTRDSIHYIWSTKYRQRIQEQWKYEYIKDHPQPELKIYTESDLLNDHPDFR